MTLEKMQRKSLITEEGNELFNIINRAGITFEEIVEGVLSKERFCPSQKKSEILFMMDLIKKNECKNICEIGTYKGGSIICFLQAAPRNANLVTIDIDVNNERRGIIKKFAKKGQHINVIKGNSTRVSTYFRTQIAFRFKTIDFLFIDGDHSLFGVMNDYVRYAPLVRKGGIIVFHDINPDRLTKYGIRSISNVGDVPSFWQLLTLKNNQTSAFIENSDQDGFGLGILIKE
jgi:predicted O-methyltransferase YrrM